MLQSISEHPRWKEGDEIARLYYFDQNGETGDRQRYSPTNAEFFKSEVGWSLEGTLLGGNERMVVA
jgi:hypothetical protein